MDGIIEETVKAHFVDDETMLLPMVSMEIKKHLKNRTQPGSLSLNCIKNIIRNQVKPNSVGEVRYKLIFREPLDIIETSQQRKENVSKAAESSPFTNLFWTVVGRLFSIENQVPLLKNDPFIMMNVVEQNLCSEETRTVYVYIMEKMCRVEVNRQLVVEVPSDLRSNYDIYWPLIFGNLAFLKNIYYIEFLLEVKTGFIWDKLKMWMEKFISNLPIVTPEDEEWAKAAQRTDRAVYLISNVVLKNQEWFSQVYIAEPDWLDQNPGYRRIYNR